MRRIALAAALLSTSMMETRNRSASNDRGYEAAKAYKKKYFMNEDPAR